MDANESLEADVVGYNKGGLLVDVEGVSGFVPLSQLLSVRQDRSDSSDESLSAMVGQPLRLKVIELNRRRSRAILSERAAMQEWRAQQKEKLLTELQEGEIRRGRITGIRDFGIFVDIGGADGLAHMSEISWSKDKSPESMFKVGEEIDVYILKVDHENRKIALSLRRAQPEQWDNLIDRYEVGQVVQGQITKLTPFGAFARIEEGLEGLVHVSELAERRINHPKEVVKEGDVLPLKIVRIERDRHRLGLSLKQAREEAEADGYVFNDAGSIIGTPGEEEEGRLGEASASAEEPIAGVAAQEEEDADQ
jgi:small subunit ribosomal protein S1